MFYRILRVIATISFKIFYRRIYTANVHKVPKDKPTILICNHPNGFMEPCLLACFLPVSLYFLVRGDLFSVWWLKALLKATHQIPIFRFQDGSFGQLRTNASTFDYCYSILKEHKHILIFPEGSTEQLRYIRPFQRGMARLAYGAMEKYPDLDLQICPVSIHFSHPTKPRSDVMINVGDSIPVKTYFELAQKDLNSAFKKLIEDSNTELKSIAIDSPQRGNEPFFEQVIDFNFQERSGKSFFPIHNRNSHQFIEEQQLLSSIDLREERQYQYIVAQGDSYFESLKKLSIGSSAPVLKSNRILFRIVFVLLGLIPALIGLALNFLPPMIGKIIADRQVKDMQFYSSVMAATAMFFYVIYWLLLVILGLIFFRIYGLFILLLPILGIFSLSWLSSFQKLCTQLKWIFLKTETKNRIINQYVAFKQSIKT